MSRHVCLAGGFLYQCAHRAWTPAISNTLVSSRTSNSSVDRGSNGVARLNRHLEVTTGTDRIGELTHPTQT